tara:strand:+ start:248 stop:1297 length:1050 start_codon:yes stop_codon:yes gene_type:complete
MGQFKPMVKMETTEPSVVLKLKKGGHVNMKKGGNGHSPMKKMDGGPMGNMGAMNTPAMIRPPVVGGPSIGAPRRPSMADRRKMMAMAAMMKNRPAAGAPMGGLPTMKKGGKAGEVETPAMHKMEMKGIKGIGKELKSHESKPASKAHAGLKKGGMATGGVRLANAGGYKKGGAAKKFANGGRVDSGRAVSMSQGHKKPTPPVSTNRFAGTFKKGGSASRMAGGGIAGLTGNYQTPDLTSMPQGMPRDPSLPVMDSEGRPSRPLEMTPMQQMPQGGGAMQNTINNMNSNMNTNANTNSNINNNSNTNNNSNYSNNGSQYPGMPIPAYTQPFPPDAFYAKGGKVTKNGGMC